MFLLVIVVVIGVFIVWERVDRCVDELEEISEQLGAHDAPPSRRRR